MGETADQANFAATRLASQLFEWDEATFAAAAAAAAVVVSYLHLTDLL